jgi:hypothetical protein
MIRNQFDKKHFKEYKYRVILRPLQLNSIIRFQVPEINFKAKTYLDLFDWTKIEISEPPLTKQFSNSELQQLVDKGEKSPLWSNSCFQLPNNTQAVERCVKNVTETSKLVAGEERRDGYIKAKFFSRSLMPSFKTKQNFNNFS